MEGRAMAKLIERAEQFARPYRIDHGGRFRMRAHDPADIGPFAAERKDAKDRAQGALREGMAHLAEMQEKLYAQDQWSLLLVFQATDAAGKDGTIKHVMSGINPQGCQVHAFKAPSPEELDHDFLWRCSTRLPERGRIGIFNRSYYEEVLVVRVHPEYLGKQRLPKMLVGKEIWKQRYEDINAYERYLSRNGTVIRKFFLHVSRAEQKKRFLERLDDPAKNWKFAEADIAERAHWNAYMAAYEDMIRATATPHAPWYVIPADSKWYTRLVVAAAIYDALDDMGLAYPTVDPAKRRELTKIRDALKRPTA
jgi:PPK2 family polyphosphate:nucleotide phosphotransferase